jgi:glycosyltransferase involved in cell wall biosynthesis
MFFRRAAKRTLIAAGTPFAYALAGRPPKRISALIRVKNEVQFLERSIRSVMDLVDEVVIVDNCSTDGSEHVIADFSNRYPKKVKSFNYPHKVARYGEEMLQLGKTKAGRQSPSFLPNYYNWSTALCASPYVLKWDGDTIATAALAGVLERFRRSKTQILSHTGINLHPDLTCYIAGRPLEDMEPRLFFRRFSKYNHYKEYCETFWSPYFWWYTSLAEIELEPLYFHMKFCKTDRFSNMSEDLQKAELAMSGRGAPLPQYLLRQVSDIAASDASPTHS